MSRALVLVPLLLTGCLTTVGEGQKVTVLLSSRTVTCEAQGDGTSLAYLNLDQADDLYLAEFIDGESGVVHTIDGYRDGLVVTFECPKGFTDFDVRHATVLQAARDDGGNGSGGGSSGGTPPR